jgi:thiol-disulfide isomerase/thioredoxin
MDGTLVMNQYCHLLSFVGLSLGGFAATVGVTATVAADLPDGDVTRNHPIVAQAGSPLPSQLQGKPVVVEIHADWCSKCQAIAPTLSALRRQYQGKAHFVAFDVTNRTTTQAATARARELGLVNFFAANRSRPSAVAIIDPRTGRVLRQFFNNPRQQDYTAVLNGAIAQLQRR